MAGECPDAIPPRKLGDHDKAWSRNPGKCPVLVGLVVVAVGEIDQPVYVLTSHETFSGGEEFTFELKTQKRATIVGETTGGRRPSRARYARRRSLHDWCPLRPADQPCDER
jgi:Peptidase family S41